MFLAKYGTGEKVIVGLHGWSGDHTTFLPLIHYLPKDSTFYSVDMPGTGKSNPPREWKIDTVVAQLQEEILALNMSPITIIGSCTGGLMALFLAKSLTLLNLSSKIERLILIDPYAYFPWYFKVFVAPEMGKIGWYAYYSTFGNPIGRWLTNLSLSRHRTEKTNLTESFSGVNHEATYRQLQILIEGGTAQQFNIIKTPVDIVYGENTFGVVKKSVKIWREILPNARCLELSNAGHLPIEEATAALATITFQNN